MRRHPPLIVPSLREMALSLAVLAAASHAATTPPAAEPDPDRTEEDDIKANLKRAAKAETQRTSDYLQPWRNARNRWRERSGFDCSITYHTYAAAALLGHHNTGWSGDATLQGIWVPAKRWFDNPFEVRFRMRYRHDIGHTPASGIGPDIGTLWGVTDGFSDSGFEVPDLYLRQVFPSRGIEIRYGQLTIDSQLDKHSLRSSKTSFLNQAFSSNPAVAFPRFGAGFTFLKNFDNGLNLTFGLSNVQGTQTGEQVDFKFASDSFFEAIQLGYELKTRGNQNTRLQILLWHSDAVDSSNRPEGKGVSFTAEQEPDDGNLRAFAKLAWSDGGAAAVRFLASAGIAAKTREDDLFGIAAGIGRGWGPDNPTQISLETFYRWHFKDGIHITPDFQILAGDSFDNSPGLRFLFGLRAGFLF